MLTPYYLVRLFKIESKQALAIGIEGGLKNSAIGLLIATTFLKIPEIELLILAYSFVSFYLTLVVSLVIQKIEGYNSKISSLWFDSIVILTLNGILIMYSKFSAMDWTNLFSALITQLILISEIHWISF